MQRLLGPRLAYYRLFYVLISTITFIPVLYLQLTIDSPLLWGWPPALRVLQAAGLGVSLLIFFLAGRQYDQAFFFGVRQIREYRAGTSAHFSGFVATGILRRMRHPYYTAGILLMLFWGSLTWANLIMKVVGIAYFVIGAFLEEKKLLAEYGDAYRRYRQEVPMFLPWPKLRRRA